MKNNLNQLTIKQALEGMKKKEFSSLELVEACLEQIKKHDKNINAFITVSGEQARKEAKRIDKNPQDGSLEGIPIALKDLFLTLGTKTTAGARVIDNYIPQYDSTVVGKLKKAGAIIIGKLNQDQWGYGASGENSDYGVTRNPWDLTRVAGGSSSGSAASLATQMCLAASGTDTGGSIRNPASFCGVIGLKPTYGRVSRYGIVAMTSSLDSIGHLTKTVWDSAKYLEVTAGKDPFDATTADEKVPLYTKLLNDQFDWKNLKIGLPKEFFVKGVDPDVSQSVKEAVKLMENRGAKISEISLPHTEYGVPTYYIIVTSETSSNRGKYDGIRYGNNRSSFTDEAKRRIMLGTYSLSAGYYDAYYKKAMQVKTLIIEDFAKAFSKLDIIISPVVPFPAFKFGEKKDPLQMYRTDILTNSVNLAGLPALALPCGFSKENLPIGMQIIGPQFTEDLLFRVGHAYQMLTNWHKHKPKLKGEL